MIPPSRTWALALLPLWFGGAVTAQGPNAPEQEIHRLLDESASSWNRGDLDGHLADNADSISFMTSKGPIVGKERTAEALRRSFFRELEMLFADVIAAPPAPPLVEAQPPSARAAAQNTTRVIPIQFRCGRMIASPFLWMANPMRRARLPPPALAPRAGS